MLSPILDDLILCASGKDTKIEDFWQKSCHHLSFGSGPSYLSGWLTVFTVFTYDGQWRGENNYVPGKQYKLHINAGGKASQVEADPYLYDYPVIDTCEITSNAVNVPIKVIDSVGTFDTTMYAGSFLTDITENGYTIQPRTDFVLINNGVCL